MILKGSQSAVTSATTLGRATRIRVNATNAGTITIAAPIGTFNAQSAVDGAAITISSHGFTTGDEVTYSDGGGTKMFTMSSKGIPTIDFDKGRIVVNPLIEVIGDEAHDNK